MDVQKRFFNHFLKGEANEWDKEAPLQLNIRQPFTSDTQLRTETEWPLRNTLWKPIYLDAQGGGRDLTWKSPTESFSVSFKTMDGPLTFLSPPLEKETEITGPLVANLLISSSTTDADLFVTLQAFAPDGREVEFQGTVGPHAVGARTAPRIAS